jgi:hypothetical protein
MEALDDNKSPAKAEVVLEGMSFCNCMCLHDRVLIAFLTVTGCCRYLFLLSSGVLLKQGSRARKNWHDRYFVVQADNTLTYYSKKGDPKAKGIYAIDKLKDLLISDIYVEKHNKQLVYCINITWTEDLPTTEEVNESSHFNDDASSAAGSLVHFPNVGDDAPQSPARSEFTADVPPQNPDFDSPTSAKVTPTKKGRRSASNGVNRVKRPQRGSDSSVARSADPGRSVDGESLTVASRLRRRRGGSRSGNAVAPDIDPVIPLLVEVDQRHAVPQTSTFDDDPNPTVQAGNKTAATATATAMKRTSYQEQRDEEQELLRSQYLSTHKMNKKKKRRKFLEGAKLAAATGAAVGVAFATFGIGLIAGVAVLGAGAAAGGGGAAMNVWQKKREEEIAFGSTDYEVAKLWKSTLEACCDSNTIKKSKWGQLFMCDGRKTRSVLLPHDRKTIDFSAEANNSSGAEKRDRTVIFENNTKWRPLEGGWTSFLGTGVQGLRMFREEREDRGIGKNNQKQNRAMFTGLSIEGRPCPPVKAQVVLGTSPLDAFLCLMSYARINADPRSILSPNSGQSASFRLVASIDDHTDVIHMICRPLYLFPSWTTPRDFVLYRYWRFEQNGTYTICYESVQHCDCPPHPDFVRGEMHQVYTIAPQKKVHRRGASTKTNDQPECFMTAVVQVDPKGWVPNLPIPMLSNQGYGDAFGVSALLQLLDIRDAIDQDRFVPVSLENDTQNLVQSTSYGGIDGVSPEIARIVSLDSAEEIADDHLNYDFAYAGRESINLKGSDRGIASRPEGLCRDKWAEPDPNSFRVRGESYKTDSNKINAGPSIGRLVAVDVVRVDHPLFSGFTTHPTERVQLALRREASLLEKGLQSDMPPFIFVVNIVLPGPPMYHGVFYFAVDDLSTIDGTDGTPSSRLCNEFLFGDSDEFRDKTFKLIPQIVQGNFIVRKAVGSTPAIMGKKLRQEYVRTDRFFEVILDCGSSAVATGVIRLSLGYAKTLVVDMGFLFEGDEESALPERIFGCARVKRIDFGPSLRKVEHPPSFEA